MPDKMLAELDQGSHIHLTAHLEAEQWPQRVWGSIVLNIGFDNVDAVG